MTDPISDPLIRAFVDEAVAPYETILSPEQLQAMRALLEVMLAVHPELSVMMARLRAREVEVAASGELDKDAEESDPQDPIAPDLAVSGLRTRGRGR